MRGRYAPSPTGFLHLGNARTALLAYAQTRARGGTFIMRVEDLDAQRSRPEFVRANLDELGWLGLTWDEGPYVQSERADLYQQALETLYSQGHLFECYLSRKEVQDVVGAPHGSAPVYGSAQRQQNARARAHKQRAGKTPSLRFLTPDDTLTLTDGVQGRVALHPARDTGDFVVRRADGAWAYQLAVVVDDVAMGITHVLRGDDLLPSTGAQLLLYRALGAEPPTFAHVPLLLDTDGTRLAKRRGSLTLTALRAAGVHPERVLGLLAYSLGVQAELEETDLQTFAKGFDLGAIGREAFRLEREQLAWLLSGR